MEFGRRGRGFYAEAAVVSVTILRGTIELIDGLRWHARVVTGSFLPAEIARMILDLYPGSHPDLGFSL